MPDSATTDARLVAQCLAGESVAWKALVDRYQGLVYSVVRRYFKDSTLAEDVFQDVWLELYRRLDSIEDVQALPAWLMTVARRKCGQAVGDYADWKDIEADNIPEMDQQMARLERQFWIRHAMSELEERDRALIQALYLDPDQPSYAEIAERLDMPVSSIGPTRARCLEKIRRRWSGRPASPS